MKDKFDMDLSLEQMDEIIEKTMQIAKSRMNTTREESLKKLVSLVNQDSKNGARKEDTIDKLIACGVKKETAEAVVEKLLEKKPYKEVLIFLAIGILTSTTFFCFIYFLIEVEITARLSWYLVAAIFTSLLLADWVEKIRGKIAFLTSYYLTIFSAFSTTILAISLFMHHPWERIIDIPARGRWGAILNTIVEIFYFFGPFGWGAILAIFSILLWFGAWGKRYDAT